MKRVVRSSSRVFSFIAQGDKQGRKLGEALQLFPAPKLRAEIYQPAQVAPWEYLFFLLFLLLLPTVMPAAPPASSGSHFPEPPPRQVDPNPLSPPFKK